MKANTTLPKLAATRDATSVRCWFVIHDDAKNSGYACVDGRVSDAVPGGGGLFQKIADLREAMEKEGLTNVAIAPEFGGKVPDRWEIRGLNQEELKILNFQ